MSRARARQFGTNDRIDLHDKDVGGYRAGQERIQRRIAAEATVPIGLSVDLDRREHLRQAGRGEHGLGPKLSRPKDAGSSRPDIGRGDVDGQLRLRVHAVEVDHVVQDAPQRMAAHGVEVVGRKHPRQPFEEQIARRRIKAVVADHPVQRAALYRRKPCGIADRLPEPREALPRAVAPPFGHAVCKGDSVHGPGAGPADRPYREALILKDPVQHPPCHRPVRATALQGKRDGLDRCLGHSGHPCWAACNRSGSGVACA